MARKPLSKRTRFEVFKRDQFTCQYCGAHPPQAILHVDHIVAVANGGDGDMSNLVTACSSCNLGKSAKPLNQVPQSLAEQAAEVKEREEQLRGYSDIMSYRRERLEDETWKVADIFISQFKLEGINKDWFQSIKRFVDKLGVNQVLDAMDLAVARKPYHNGPCFRYFCGICWKIIKGPGNAS